MGVPHLRQQVPRGRQRALLPPAALERVPKGSLPDHRFNQDLQDQVGVGQGVTAFLFIQEQQEHPTLVLNKLNYRKQNSLSLKENK